MSFPIKKLWFSIVMLVYQRVFKKCFTQNRRKDTYALATKYWLYCCWSSEIIVAEIMMKFGVHRSLWWWNPRFSSSKFRFWWNPYHFSSFLPVESSIFAAFSAQKWRKNRFPSASWAPTSRAVGVPRSHPLPCPTAGGPGRAGPAWELSMVIYVVV